MDTKKTRNDSKVAMIVIGIIVLLAIAFVSWKILGIRQRGNVEEPTAAPTTAATIAAEVDKTLEEAQGLVEAGDYESALSLLEEKQEIDVWNDAYAKAYEKYKADYNKKIREEALTEAKEKAEKGNNVGALKVIKDAMLTIGEDHQLQTAMDGYADAYVSEIVDETNTLAEQGEFEKALKKVDAALDNLPDSAQLQAQQTFIKSQEPVYLYDLQYSGYDNKGVSSNRFEVINGKVTTYTGAEYDKGLVFYQAYRTGRSLFYSLKAAYTKLTGSVVMVEAAEAVGMEGSTNADDFVYVEILGDGVSLYKSPLTNRTVELDFSVDVQGVNELEIKIIPENEDGGRTFDGWYRAIYLAITGCELTKNPNHTADTPDTEMGEADAYLYDLQYSGYDNKGASDNRFEVINGKVSTHTGAEYDKGLVFYQAYRTGRSLFYSLNAAYTKLTGSVVMVEAAEAVGMEGSTNADDFVYVEILGDGASLYKSPLTNRTVELDFSVDVQGVNELEIKIIPENEDGGRTFDGWYRAMYMALVGLELYE